MIADAWCAIAGSSSEPSRDGSTKRVAKVAGKVGATSEIVLFCSQISHIKLLLKACLMSCARSPSDISPKLPNDSQILINLFDLKKPPSLALSERPISRKPLALRRARGFGFKSFLNEGNMEVGIEPLDEACGGG